MQEICRLCRRYDANTISLIDGDRIRGITMREKIKTITQIQISSQDKLPTRVCPLCVWNLNLSFRFITEIKKSHDWFTKSLAEEAAKSPERTFSPPPLDNFGADTTRDSSSPRNDVDIGGAPQDEESLDSLPELPDPVEEAAIPEKLKRKPPKRKRKYICDVCGKAWIWKRSLQQHLYTHFKKLKREKPLKCDKCDKRYETLGLLKHHIEVGHLGVRKYICEICGQKFATESNVKIHNKVVHCGEKPFKCKICSRAFARLGNCKTHELRHDRSTRYFCDICDRSYSGLSNLKSHQTIHTIGKRFKCDICNKKFVSKAGLNDHFRTHTGEKPFKCPFCEMTFAQRNSMRCHIKTHPEARTFPCPICGRKYLREDVLRDHIEKFH